MIDVMSQSQSASKSLSQPVVQQFWATNFYALPWPEHAQQAPGLLEYLYQLRDEQTGNIASGISPAVKSSEGLYESDFDLLARDHPGIVKFREFAARAVARAVSHVNGGELQPSQIRVEFLDSWYHITNAGGFHDCHGHGGCSWCGIYYLQAGSSGQRTGAGAANGANRFYSPLSRGGTYLDYGAKYLTLSHVDPPIADGTLILFPSYLMHSGLPYTGEQDRVIISFNSRSVPAPGVVLGGDSR